MSVRGAVDVVATTLPMPPVGALVAALVAVVPVVRLAVVFDVDLAVVPVDAAVVPVTAAVLDVVPPVSAAVVVVTSSLVDVVDSDDAVFLDPPPPQAGVSNPAAAAIAISCDARADKTSPPGWTDRSRTRRNYTEAGTAAQRL